MGDRRAIGADGMAKRYDSRYRFSYLFIFIFIFIYYYYDLFHT
jgi:hypothetical protein